MKYYHVLILENGEKNKTVIHTDLNEEQLSDRFIKRFQNEENLFFEDRIMRHSNINGATIIKTEEPFDDIMKKAEAETSKKNKEFLESGFVLLGSIHKRDIEDYGENVTSEFIKEAPQKTEPLYSIITENPLWSGIIITIFGALLTYYFALN